MPPPAKLQKPTEEEVRRRWAALSAEQRRQLTCFDDAALVSCVRDCIVALFQKQVLMQKYGMRPPGLGPPDLFLDSALLTEVVDLAWNVERSDDYPDSLLMDAEEQVPSMSLKESVLHDDTLFDRMQFTLPDFLAAKTGRNPMPRAKWKQLFAIEPSSVGMLEKHIVELIEQSLWRMGSDPACDVRNVGSAVQEDSPAVLLDDIGAEELALDPSSSSKPGKKSKNKKKKKKAAGQPEAADAFFPGPLCEELHQQSASPDEVLQKPDASASDESWRQFYDSSSKSIRADHACQELQRTSCDVENCNATDAPAAEPRVAGTAGTSSSAPQSERYGDHVQGSFAKHVACRKLAREGPLQLSYEHQTSRSSSSTTAAQTTEQSNANSALAPHASHRETRDSARTMSASRRLAMELEGRPSSKPSSRHRVANARRHTSPWQELSERDAPNKSAVAASGSGGSSFAETTDRHDSVEVPAARGVEDRSFVATHGDEEPPRHTAPTEVAVVYSPYWGGGDQCTKNEVVYSPSWSEDGQRTRSVSVHSPRWAEQDQRSKNEVVYSPHRGKENRRARKQVVDSPRTERGALCSPGRSEDDQHTRKERVYSPRRRMEISHSPRTRNETCHSPCTRNETCRSPRTRNEVCHTPRTTLAAAYSNFRGDSDQHTSNELSHSPRPRNEAVYSPYRREEDVRSRHAAVYSPRTRDPVHSPRTGKGIVYSPYRGAEAQRRRTEGLNVGASSCAATRHDKGDTAVIEHHYWGPVAAQAEDGEEARGSQGALPVAQSDALGSVVLDHHYWGLEKHKALLEWCWPGPLMTGLWRRGGWARPRHGQPSRDTPVVRVQNTFLEVDDAEPVRAAAVSRSLSPPRLRDAW